VSPPPITRPADGWSVPILTGDVGWSRAERELEGGQVVAVPTDTVFGLAARADRVEAVEAIFALKGRPAALALPVIVADVAQARALSAGWSEGAEALTGALWPGALTVVVDAVVEPARLLGSEDGSLGFRCPAHDALRDLCRRTGPLAVTSANLHGQPPCTSAEEVAETFSGRPGPRISLALEGGPSGGDPSTVVDCRGPEPVVLRSGALAWSVVREAWGSGAASGTADGTGLAHTAQ